MGLLKKMEAKLEDLYGFLKAKKGKFEDFIQFEEEWKACGIRTHYEYMCLIKSHKICHRAVTQPT